MNPDGGVLPRRCAAIGCEACFPTHTGAREITGDNAAKPIRLARLQRPLFIVIHVKHT